MTEEAASKSPLETGGILMGYVSKPRGDPVVLFAAGPGPQAEHRRCGYSPDQKHDESVIATLYEAAERRLTYLGDWHTHPLPTSCLSWRDRRVLKRIAMYSAARLTKPIMLLLVCQHKWHPIIWRGSLVTSRLWFKTFAVETLTVRVF
ncbi:Mov34/MPN/PAD-1 family protein [Candidatus Bathyarchaeota archaeon]|nr:Mov34/MPN/PAD-1 family protein [Candidatus Bathyarchaeota archaeon]